MTDSDKIALHYKVIANMAHKIEKVSKELSVLYTDSIFNKKLLLNELWKQIVIQFSVLLMGCLMKLKTEGYRISYVGGY